MTLGNPRTTPADENLQRTRSGKTNPEQYNATPELTNVQTETANQIFVYHSATEEDIAAVKVELATKKYPVRMIMDIVEAVQKEMTVQSLPILTRETLTIISGHSSLGHQKALIERFNNGKVITVLGLKFTENPGTDTWILQKKSVAPTPASTPVVAIPELETEKSFTETLEEAISSGKIHISESSPIIHHILKKLAQAADNGVWMYADEIARGTTVGNSNGSITLTILRLGNVILYAGLRIESEKHNKEYRDNQGYLCHNIVYRFKLSRVPSTETIPETPQDILLKISEDSEEGFVKTVFEEIAKTPNGLSVPESERLEARFGVVVPTIIMMKKENTTARLKNTPIKIIKSKNFHVVFRRQSLPQISTETQSANQPKLKYIHPGDIKRTIDQHQRDRGRMGRIGNLLNAFMRKNKPVLSPREMENIIGSDFNTAAERANINNSSLMVSSGMMLVWDSENQGYALTQRSETTTGQRESTITDMEDVIRTTREKTETKIAVLQARIDELERTNTFLEARVARRNELDTLFGEGVPVLPQQPSKGAIARK